MCIVRALCDVYVCCVCGVLRCVMFYAVCVMFVVCVCGFGSSYVNASICVRICVQVFSLMCWVLYTRVGFVVYICAVIIYV